MATQVTYGTGKLYDADGKQVITTVIYQIREKPQTELTLGEWRGSFVFEQKNLFLTDEYILELQDRRRGKILISHVTVRPEFPNYYEFQGSGALT